MLKTPMYYRLHLWIPILILIGLLAGVVGFSLRLAREPAVSEASPLPQTSPAGQNNIVVELMLEADPVRHGDLITPRVTVVNTGDSPATITFPTTCIEPTLLFDGQPLGEARVCGAALTDVALEGGERKEYWLSLRLVEPANDENPFDEEFGIEAGRHEVRAAWNDQVSKGVTIHVENRS